MWSKLFSKFSFAILFMLFTLFLCFLYSLISLSLLNFKTFFLNQFLMRISFRISLLNHGLSLFRIVTIFDGIHSFAIFRKQFVYFSHISSTSFKWSSFSFQLISFNFSSNFSYLIFWYCQISLLSDRKIFLEHLIITTEASWSLILYHVDQKKKGYVWDKHFLFTLSIIKGRYNV